MSRGIKSRWGQRPRQVGLVVRLIRAGATRGCLDVGGRTFPCAVGRSGRRALKREGDGATPIGRWQLLEVLYRADRGLPPSSALPARAMRPGDGWCDAAGDRNYNRPVRHPYAASAEQLWRDDHLYDLVVVLGYNVRPRARGLGSAIFLHLAHPDRRPTAGCVALSARDLRLVLARIGRRAELVVPA